MESVQHIASHCKKKDTIPSEFVGPEKEQPAATTVHGVILEMPVIDLKDHERYSYQEENSLIKIITEASQDWGVFQMVNHGIPDEVIKNLQNVGKHFFDLPGEEKELIAKTYESGNEGYGTMLTKGFDGKKCWGDHLFHKIWPPAAINYNFWPNNPPTYKEANEKYGEKVRVVSDKLLRWLSLGLGLEGHELKAGMGGEDTVFLLKINYYPACPRPDLVFGSVGHCDVSALTILVPNEVQGLQILRNNHWYDVNCMPNALVIFIGEQIEVLSNGKYKAVHHRSIVNKDKVRMSWPVFVEPPADFEVGPIPKLLNSSNKVCNSPSKYKAKKYKDYVYCRLNKLPL